jgi:hypothetical protein
MDTNYFLVCAECGHWTVSARMAKAIEVELDRWVLPRWICFVDLTGARIRIRAKHVNSVSQCYAETRAAERSLRRRLEEEDVEE